MNKVIRVISALGAGASLVWGIARSMRRKRGNTDDGGPDWPPKDAEQAARAAPQSSDAATEAEAPEAPAAAQEPETTDEPVEAAPAAEEAADAPAEVEAAQATSDDSSDDDASEEPPVVKGVEFENPAAVVELVNSVDEEGLKDLGIKGKTNQRVLETRPIESVHDLAVPGIGRRTLQALAGATE